MKDIPGWEHLYAITKEGDIWSYPKRSYIVGRFLKPNVDRGGYLKVELCRNGYRRTMSVHRLVALTYIPNPNHLPQINHKDAIKINNHVSNLEWCTLLQNVRHSISFGLNGKRGSKNAFSKLIESEVIKIRMECKTNTQKILAKKYDVSQNQISRIITRKDWVHI